MMYQHQENLLSFLIHGASLAALKKLWLEFKNDDEEKINYMPSLYIDFDNKELISMYPEPASYEDYVPEGWKSEFKDFMDLIPKEYCYWE